MTFAGFFKAYSNDQIAKILDILRKCSTKDDARFNVADSVSMLANSNLLWKYSEDQFLKLMGILKNCSATDHAKSNEKIIELLIECLKFDGAEKEVFQTFESLAEDYCFFEYETEEMLKIARPGG